MPSTKDVLLHQLRQMVVYSFYFSVFQSIAIHYALSARWTFFMFLFLLGTSVYEDTVYFDQDTIPESILTLRIWSNNIPLWISNLFLYVLERGHFIEVNQHDKNSAKKPGSPDHVVIKVAPTGLSPLDDLFTCAAYYLFYFSTFAMFRVLVAQFRFVRRLLQENLSWSSDGPDDDDGGGVGVGGNESESGSLGVTPNSAAATYGNQFPEPTDMGGRSN